ncbi:MAG: flagellar hook-associated protein FlgK [Clostridiaceae bacterium]|nr:flagellar hook-associated protein FlgK [Clostridiaceae bacterium]MBW4860019.1 flagellar hook-associated protein FlgK [Clostridiaceae bacterium]MBW4867109.1 flagellar hook-associated protein FlgK [Clostridiaceae bacterium]
MYGFNSAVSGLIASQRSLYVTNHNLNNMNTDGYSRQVANQRATAPFHMPGVGFLGTGTEIYDIERMRNSYIDLKYWNESAPMGEWEVKKNTLMEIEKLFGEVSDSSFRQYMDDFFESLTNLSTNSSDFSYREPVKETAIALTKHINETAKRLENLKNETEFVIETKVKQINDIGEQIAALNKQIYALEIDGNSANDLRDQRELLVDELSKIVNVRVDESKDGKYKVSISGITLVDHDYITKMEYRPKDKNDINSPKELKWANGNDINLKSGELKGLLDLVDGNGEDGKYRGIPYYQNKLNDFAKGFAEGINEQHRLGYGLDESHDIDFFTMDEKNPAATIAVSNEIIEDLRKIAVAGEPGGVEDNKNLLKIIALREDNEFFTDGMSKGNPDDFIKAILSNMAVDSMQANRMKGTQEVVMKNILRRRQSESGVSIDEEIGNLVRFQHAYVSAAKMITTFDTILDVTINRLGLVGR